MIKLNHLKAIGFLAFTSLSLMACLTLPDPSSADEAKSPGSIKPPTDQGEEPTPNWSTDPDDEQERYNQYLRQAGFNNPSQLGSEKEVQACEVRVHQGSVSFDSGITKECFWQQSEPGFVIESVRVEVKENVNNRGSYASSVVAADGQYNSNIKEIGDKWDVALGLAGKAKDFEVQKKLDVGYQQHMERVLSVSSNKNTVRLEATANAGVFQTSTIDVVAFATLIRVQ